MKPLKLIQQEEDYIEVNHHKSALPELAAFLIFTCTIIFFGLIVLYSTSSGVAGISYFKKQLVWAALGVGGCLTVFLIGYKKLSDRSPWLMLGIAVALGLCLFFDPVNGARRWIRIGSVTIQPSEFAKLIVVLFLAKFLSERTRLIETNPFRIFMQGGICCAVVIGLVLLGHDLGTSVLLGLLFLAMMFAAGIRLRYILPWVFIGPPLLYILIKLFSPVRLARITNFLNPEINQADQGYQLWLSFLALGSGKWFGVGFTESRLKQHYLPELHTDFILSIVGEELGFVYLLFLILLYIVFILSALSISCKARTRQGMLIVFGVLSFIAIQAVINIGVISGGFPTKGMPAPFISYGGSSLITCITATGLIFSVGVDNVYPDYRIWIFNKLKGFFRSIGSMIYTKEKGKEQQ